MGNAHKFQVGDCVKAIGTEIEMTVMKMGHPTVQSSKPVLSGQDVGPEEIQYYCQWFVKNLPRGAYFSEAQLQSCEGLVS